VAADIAGMLQWLSGQDAGDVDGAFTGHDHGHDQ